jgi:DNA replication protein DnaC
MLDQLLERRTLAGRTVLLASNLTDELLEQHLGDRLWSRLRASTKPIVMTGKDWRAEK